MNRRDLLIEIGTEELPPRALKKLASAFCTEVRDSLQKAELGFNDIKTFASPRRLALVITHLDETQKDKQMDRRGPAVQAAFDDEGRPSKAAEGFARSCGVSVDELDTLETDNGSWLTYRVEEKGQPTASLVPSIVQNALDKLPIPRRMRWGDLDAQFVRPVHWVILLFGDEVIDAEILSVKSGRETRGHRFHAPDNILVPHPDDYEVLLESKGRVIADFDRRRDTVRARVEEVAVGTGGSAVIDEDLLDEVTAMVEWPVPVLGQFEKHFLQVPQEALISTMKTNQKYFHLVDKKGRLLPYFITISNIDSKDIDKVREGNERVIRPRFADAEFFWNQDRKQRLESRMESLKNVVFQHQLGSLYDKSVRVSELAAVIAKALGADIQQTQRAAMLSRCDLMSDMVFEFPELQGVMGRYYALHDKEPGDIPQALDEIYMPRFAGDQLPQTATGQALALAERIDTLTGIFGIGQPPTGDKDPFALRRAALGALRILVELKLDLDLYQLIDTACSNLAAGGIKLQKDTASHVFDFMLERLRAYYSEQGILPDVFEAVLAQRVTRPSDFNARIHAVTAFRKLAESDSLAAANKRIGNILKKVNGHLPEQIDIKLHQETEETDLYNQLTALNADVTPLLAQRRYTDALKQLAKLRQPVDNYFDRVMVMAEDKKLRDNRIALLNRVHGLFLQVADISKLQG